MGMVSAHSRAIVGDRDLTSGEVVSGCRRPLGGIHHSQVLASHASSSGVERRVRAGGYRIVHEIHDDVLLILVVAVGHRREIHERRWFFRSRRAVS